MAHQAGSTSSSAVVDPHRADSSVNPIPKSVAARRTIDMSRTLLVATSLPAVALGALIVGCALGSADSGDEGSSGAARGSSVGGGAQNDSSTSSTSSGSGGGSGRADGAAKESGADSGVSESGSAGDPVLSNACKVQVGTYKQHYAVTGSASCVGPADETVTITDGAALPPNRHIPNNTCVDTIDNSTCTITTVCTIRATNYTNMSTAVTTTHPTSLSGTLDSKAVGEDGGVFSDCTFEFTFTKL
jgi:hypothetical protein